jgi:hypothetical protein
MVYNNKIILHFKSYVNTDINLYGQQNVAYEYKIDENIVSSLNLAAYGRRGLFYLSYLVSAN